MRILIYDNKERLNQWAADYICNKVSDYHPTPNRPFVLGLPTGSTPIGVYKHLIQQYKEYKILFQNVITFNMDEYVGLPEDHAESYHAFMEKHLFSQINIPRENINFLNGNDSIFTDEV